MAPTLRPGDRAVAEKVASFFLPTPTPNVPSILLGYARVARICANQMGHACCDLVLLRSPTCSGGRLWATSSSSGCPRPCR
jgi:hypothetical protein